MAIYTKRGDGGQTSLYNGDTTQRIRISKSSLEIKAIGAIDEVNSYLGITITESKNEELKNFVERIQNNLFTIGSILAGAKLKFSSNETKKLEIFIDNLEGTLPTLQNFILPGGTLTSANLQYSRTLVRKAERELVALNEKKEVPPEIIKYMNRLSDAIFMLARKENFDNKVVDIMWVNSEKE